MAVPAIRISTLNDRPVNPQGDYVLYWMIAHRRTSWNFSLDRAIELGHQLQKPIIVLEALRCEYEWASDRLHRFVLQGMAHNRTAFRGSPITYHAYVETESGQGAGLLETLSQYAAAVVTDDFPCFFLPRMAQSAASRSSVLMESVDSNGIVPLKATGSVFTRAFDFRRWLQKNLLPHLMTAPQSNPLRDYQGPSASVPAKILQQWPAADDRLLTADIAALRHLPIDHSVGPACLDGGSPVGQWVLECFLDKRLERYADERNDPNDEAASGLAPYLHFGHVSAHEVVDQLKHRENWSADDLSDSTSGAREGWWGMSPPAESFLDQIITWRELGYNRCSKRDDYDQYRSLPDWAQKTLKQHASDPREYAYELPQFEAAATHDEIWNAAQRQLVRDGRMHNYLRMLWGKKILEWSATPQDALAVMIELNNKYAVDGRNPNSYSGIFWVLGLYDRAWGPERPVFGKVRYMSSRNTARKMKLKPYLQRYAKERPATLWKN